MLSMAGSRKTDLITLAQVLLAAEMAQAEAKTAPLLQLGGLQADCVLHNLVESSDCFGVGFERSLRDDQIGELGGDIHVRKLQRATRQRSAAGRSWRANDRLSRSEGCGVVSVPGSLQAVIVGEARQSQLT